MLGLYTIRNTSGLCVTGTRLLPCRCEQPRTTARTVQEPPIISLPWIREYFPHDRPIATRDNGRPHVNVLEDMGRMPADNTTTWHGAHSSSMLLVVVMRCCIVPMVGNSTWCMSSSLVSLRHDRMRLMQYVAIIQRACWRPERYKRKWLLVEHLDIQWSACETKEDAAAQLRFSKMMQVCLLPTLPELSTTYTSQAPWWFLTLLPHSSPAPANAVMRLIYRHLQLRLPGRWGRLPSVQARCPGMPCRQWNHPSSCAAATHE